MAAASQRPLSGLRVLDLSRLLPGGYCTLLMADLGADVIKVEEPGTGDYMRMMPPLTVRGESAMHLAINRGKRSMTCNLRTSEGREVFLDLARRADILVESFRPGVMDRLGVGYETLRSASAGLVYVAISGYGQSGPYTAKAGHDIDYLAYAGALSFTGHPDAGPWQPGLQIGDLAGGMAALIAALGALRVRDATGEGQLCDVSMTDVVLSWTAVHAAAYAASGTPPAPGTATLNGGLACYGVYECADGRHVAVGALEPRFFAELLDGLGLPSVLGEAQLDPARQDELRERIAGVLATRRRDEWIKVLGECDACVAPVLDMGEALDDAGARAREMVTWTRGSGHGLPTVGTVPRFSRTPGRPGGPPASLGADTEAVLAELGRGPDDVAALRAAGAV
ncbi:MAG: CaiB/BaiF CoA transferase family protein [Streptosporangiaceae bacterium]